MTSGQRCRRFVDAEADSRRAIQLATSPADRRYLARRLDECRTDHVS